MKIKSIKLLKEKYLQCDITTNTENFYIVGKNSHYLVHNSPALVFGRDQNGDFILTDKSGFTAKGYDGLYKSAEEFIKQKRSKGTSEDYLAKIVKLWPMVEICVPNSYRGFVLGDVMWFPDALGETTRRYIFTPNTVTYEVDKQSPLGKRIGQSMAGIAVHTYYQSPEDAGTSLKNTAGLNINGPVCFLGPEIKNEASIQSDKVKPKNIIQYIKKNAKAVDMFLDEVTLREQKMSGLPDLLYAFVNSEVKKKDLSDLYSKFPQWIQANPKLSKPMIAKVLEYAKVNANGLKSIFDIFDLIIGYKMDIVHQLDTHEGQVIAHIAGARGGEGYVSGDEGGPIKLVNRIGFSAANFAKNME